MNEDDNCFIHCLRLSGISIPILDEIKLMVKNGNITYPQIRDICDKYDIKIRIHEPKKETTKYGKTTLFRKDLDKDFIEICRVDDHYFLYEKDTGIYSMGVKSYSEVKDKDEWWLISKKVKGKYYVKSTEPKSMDSMNLVVNLLKQYEENKNNDENCILERIKLDELTQCLINRRKLKIKELILVDSDDTNARRCVSKYEKKIAIKEKTKFQNKENETDIDFYFRKKGRDINIGFDFETNTSGNKHVPYLVSYMIEGRDKIHTIKGRDCDIKFIKEINRELEEINREILEEELNYIEPIVTGKPSMVHVYFHLC